MLSAGMPRSGSTWLYNVLRLLLQRQLSEGQAFSSGWFANRQSVDDEGLQLLKLHKYDAEMARSARFIAYSYRDPRDALASARRKFGTPLTLGWLDDCIGQHDAWVKVAQHVLRYESMLDDPQKQARALARRLGLPATLGEAVCAEIGELSFDSAGPRNEQYHDINLFHRDHRTSDGQPGRWRTELPAALQTEIQERHAQWLQRHGYPLT